MLVAIAIGRAVALVGVTRLRTAGFDMIWSGRVRVHRATRGAPFAIGCELVNRSRETVRVTGLRAIASSMLETSVRPASVDLAPGARAMLEVTVRGLRVGRWGLHGLSLQVSATPLGAEGLYEVPLLFASPAGVEVLPSELSSFSLSARGGRSRRASETGRHGRGPGHADEIRELREHVPGDPLKRVAWKASARRGRLLVREMDRDESDVVWLVVDASIELWAGKPGTAPLDGVVDDVASLAARLLRRGDRVGLAVIASRARSWLVPRVGAAQGSLIAGALASASSAVDADRSGLGEAEVARLVAEHTRPLEPAARAPVAASSPDLLAARVESLRPRAPFATRVPFAATERERTLRRHLSSFGIESPPAARGEREKSESTLAWVLAHIAVQKPRAGVVHVWAPAPLDPGAVAKAVAALRRARVELRWSLPPFAWTGGRRHDLSTVVADEVARVRASTAHARADRSLRALGVRVVVRRPAKRALSNPPGDTAP
jgi:uncharacterized protein (DUF58 family)